MTSLAQLVPYISLATQFMGVAPLTGGVAPASRTITITAALTPGAISAQMTSSVAATVIRPMTVLSFLSGTRRVAVMVAGTVDVTLGVTAGTVPIQPISFAIAATSAAPWWVGVIPALGLTDFGGEPDPVIEEVTGTDTLGGKAFAKMRTGQKVSCTFNERPGDAAIEMLKAAAESPFDVASNLFVVMVRPDGEVKSGVGLIGGGSAPGNANAPAKQSFDVMFQGATFQRLSPGF